MDGRNNNTSIISDQVFTIKQSSGEGLETVEREKIPIGTIEFDIGNKDIIISHGAKELLGVSLTQDFISIDNIFNNLDKDDKERIISLFHDKLLKNKSINVDVKVILDIEDVKYSYYINIKAKSHSENNEEIQKISVIVSDIDDKIKIIHDLKKNLNKLEESNRLKTTFLANISHELRTPMNAILGFTELINIGALNNEKREEYTNIIKRKGNQLLTLLDDIIEISKFETGTLSINKVECNINDILDELFRFFDNERQQEGKTHIELILNKPKKKIGIIYTDSGRLYQVLSNLLYNALLSTSKGLIEFGVKVDPEKTLQFYVKDTGAGLSKEDQKYLFHRYKNIEETNVVTGETGLKLTISKGIIELLGGKIWVDSALNEGSTFYFTLPYILANADIESKIHKDITTKLDYSWKDKVILVVEDEEDNYTFIEAILHDSQAQLIHANNGKQAVELCKSISKIDLVLMDIKMPQKSGYEATREIKSIRPELPIIAQTAFSMKEDRDKCMEAGCSNYITKPFDVDIFIKMIDQYLD